MPRNRVQFAQHAAAFAALAACWLAPAAPALAQSNSLFRRQLAPPAAPRMQPDAPAAGANMLIPPEHAAAAVGLGLPLPSQPLRPAPAAIPSVPGQPAVALPLMGPPAAFVPGQNVVLMSVSPIAVAAPLPRQIRVGDLVTIIVREDKTAVSDAKFNSDKEWKINTELAKWFKLNEQDSLVPQEFPNGKPGIDFNHKDEYDGQGKYDRKDSLTLRVTARVIDVKPNGNLVLEDTKEVVVDEEGYTALLTGECRSADITAQNTVLSTQLHGLTVEVRNRGATRDATRRGWLKRGWDFLRPF